MAADGGKRGLGVRVFCKALVVVSGRSDRYRDDYGKAAVARSGSDLSCAGRKGWGRDRPHRQAARHRRVVLVGE